MHGPGDVRFFDRVAPLYDRLTPSPGVALERGLAVASRPVRRVVDVGGGTGRAAAAVDADDRVVVDASRPMLRRVSPPASPVQGDARALPLAGECADAVTVVDALHHLPNPAAVVAEARRVLAPGGVLVVVDFDPETVRGRALAFGERLVGFDSTFTPAADLARFLDARGFDARVVDGGFGYVVAGRVADGKRESQ